ncbi:hypothetical protein FBU30_005447 [Linnemannia zychae]|nr:hypothetical protein FBU30_005447 [Linnemannia zychae]
MKARTAGIAAITSKEFAQWIMPFEAASANTAIQQKINLSDTLFGKSCGSQDQRKETIRNVGIAVSGGVDSMALATLMAQHYSLQDDGRKTSLHAFIVDHKLRDNSTEEANYVAKQIQKLDIIPHVLTLNWTLSDNLKLGDSTAINKDSTLDIQSYKPNKVHLETEARLRRYKAITQKCYDLSIRDLFVGHHAGDQVETTLFRFSRASGIDGMAGIQSLAPLGVLAIPEALDIRVVRPLLQVSKLLLGLMMSGLIAAMVFVISSLNPIQIH